MFCSVGLLRQKGSCAECSVLQHEVENEFFFWLQQQRLKAIQKLFFEYIDSMGKNKRACGIFMAVVEQGVFVFVFFFEIRQKTVS